MVSSRELCRDAASFFVYFSLLLHVFILNFVHSKCPKSFHCGDLGNLEFPLADSSQPVCGLFTVECNATPPRINPDIQGFSPSYEILSDINTNQVLIRNPIIEGFLKSKSCRLFSELNITNTHKSISLIFFPNITLTRCPKNMNSEEDDEIRRLHQSYRNYTECDDFDIYYTNSNEKLPPPVPYDCSVLYLPPRSQPIPDSADLFEWVATDYNLTWSVSDDCIDCHQQGGKCSAEENDQFRCVKGKTNSKLVFIAGASTAAAVVFFSVVFFTFKKRKYNLNLKGTPQNHKDIELFLKNNENLVPRRYNYSDLKKMTNSFSDNLGEGGFASVYRGKLSDGRLVAVKILKELKGNGEEFINEVASISRTSHVNIVTLIGFCFEGSKRALIYEFMPNGSLDKFIGHNSSMVELQLGWEKLFQIAVGIAQGIEYLHQGCNTRILHFDIKPHNILLDKDFNPKISDFGLARLCPNRSSIVAMSGARGTIGYIAPEIFCRNFGDVSHKSDVYSYGMMILEMAGQTKNIEVRVDHSSESYFPDWIYQNLEQKAELDLNIIVNAKEHSKMMKMLIVGLWCIQTDPKTRPSMGKAVEMLEGNMESLQVPPNPNIFLQPREAVNLSNFESSLSSSDIHEVKL